MRVVDLLRYMLIIYLVLQLGGIVFLMLGLIEYRGYVLGLITGFYGGIILLLYLILRFLGREGERVMESIISRIL